MEDALAIAEDDSIEEGAESDENASTGEPGDGEIFCRFLFDLMSMPFCCVDQLVQDIDHAKREHPLFILFFLLSRDN